MSRPFRPDRLSYPKPRPLAWAENMTRLRCSEGLAGPRSGPNYTQELAKVDRAILDGETEGFVRVHVRKGTDEILGATIVAAHAGDLISEITVAMNGKLGLKAVGAAIHPYPTQAEAIRKVGDLYNRTRLTPFVKGLFAKWLAWQRR